MKKLPPNEKKVLELKKVRKNDIEKLLEIMEKAVLTEKNERREKR